MRDASDERVSERVREGGKEEEEAAVSALQLRRERATFSRLSAY
jgi:hypothetical protein